MRRNDEGAIPAPTPESPDQAIALEADALDTAGRRAVDAEDYVAARAAFEQELALRQQLGDQPGVVYALVHVTWVRQVGLGETTGVRPLVDEALVIARDLDSPLLIAVAVGHLGGLALDEGDGATADLLLKESYALLVPITRDAGTNGALLESLAMAAASQGQWARAVRLFGAASALREAAGIPQTHPAVVARFERYLAPARAALGAEAAVAEAQGRALDLDQAIAYALAEAGEDPSAR